MDETAYCDILEVMPYKKYRWSKDYEAAEEELEILLNTSAKSSVRCELAEYETLDEVLTAEKETLWCAEGSIIFEIDNARVSLQPGDTINIFGTYAFQATAGIAGCVYYKALA